MNTKTGQEDEQLAKLRKSNQRFPYCREGDATEWCEGLTGEESDNNENCDLLFAKEMQLEGDGEIM